MLTETCQDCGKPGLPFDSSLCDECCARREAEWEARGRTCENCSNLIEHWTDVICADCEARVWIEVRDELYETDPKFREAWDKSFGSFTHELDTTTGVLMPLHEEPDRN